MYWNKGSREYDLLNSTSGLSFWWGTTNPTGPATLYFNGSYVVDAVCHHKKMSEADSGYAENFIGSPSVEILGVTAHIGGYVYHLFPAPRFPRFLRAFKKVLGLDDALIERMQLEFSEGAKDETRHGSMEDDNDYVPEEDPPRELVPPREPSTRKRAAAAPAAPAPLVPPSIERLAAKRGGGGGAEQLTAYNLRKTIREKRAAAVAAGSGPAVAERYERTYGGRSGSKEVPQSVYANSQEENVADSRRLVYLLENDEEVFDDERPPGKDKEEEEEEEEGDARSQRLAKRSKTQKFANPPAVAPQSTPTVVGDQEDDDDAFDPIEFSDDDGDEDMVARAVQDAPEVQTETAALDEVLKIVQMTGLAMETQLKLATFVQDRANGGVYADEESRRSDLKRIQEHMMELSRSLQTWTPMDRASTKEKRYTVIDDADGTEVRMSDCAAELGIVWNAVSASTKRAIAELARDLHKKVYGRFPKKKRMPAGNGTMLPIYFYNRTTYVPTMREAMTRLLLAPLPADEPAVSAAQAEMEK